VRTRVLSSCDRFSAEYIQERVDPALADAQSKAPQLSMALRLAKFLVILGGTAAVVLQSIRLSQWVPVVLAVVSFIEYLLQHFQVDSRLTTTNATTISLMRAHIAWNSLSKIQQRMPENKDRLVDAVEGAILVQQESFVQNILSNLRKADAGSLAQPPPSEGAQAQMRGDDQRAVRA